MSKKIWIGIASGVLSLVLISAVVFGIVWGCNNAAHVQEMVQGTNIYNKQDLDNAYQDGYDTALENKDEYTNLIGEYRDKLGMADLQNKKLQNDYSSLQTVNDKLVNACEQYKTVIATLENDELAVVSFESEGILYDIKVTPKGAKMSSVNVAEPNKDNYDFLGWSVNGIDVVTDDFAITENTNLIAVFKIRKYTVKFTCDGKQDFEIVVNSGDYIKSADIQALRVRDGWTDAKYTYGFRDVTLNQSAGNTQDGSILKYKITQDTTLSYIVTEHVGDTSGGLRPFDPDKLQSERGNG